MGQDSGERANGSWVEAGLAAADRVSWRSQIIGPTLHTEKWN